ncbi:MAG: NAD(P)-dependent methylenetetrahydromethanopterin dehydrogenase [Fuerstiella sp.]
MSHPNILIQLDTDSHASVFDRVVAVDAGVDHLFSYDSVTTENVTGLVHGAMFTRGPSALKHTAIFVGGSDVAAGEAVVQKVRSTFFGPVSVSVMMDSNGCNTTAAAAVVAAGSHLDFAGCNAIVLGATGPVGLRAAQLLASAGAHVTAVSRSEARAQSACDSIASKTAAGSVIAAGADSTERVMALCAGQDVLIAAGAAGVCFIPEGDLAKVKGLRVAIDLNAVPPAGVADIGAVAKAVDQDGVICYGALGVGGTKMKVHKAAISKLFESNDQLFDTMEIYDFALAISNS